MTEQKGKGKKGPAWLDFVDANAEGDAPSPSAQVDKRGQRNKTETPEPTTTVSQSETPAVPPRGPAAMQEPPRRTPSRRVQFNQRVDADLVARVRQESEDWKARGYARGQADIVEDALRVYFAMKDEEQP